MFIHLWLVSVVFLYRFFPAHLFCLFGNEGNRSRRTMIFQPIHSVLDKYAFQMHTQNYNYASGIGWNRNILLFNFFVCSTARKLCKYVQLCIEVGLWILSSIMLFSIQHSWVIRVLQAPHSELLFLILFIIPSSLS